MSYPETLTQNTFDNLLAMPDEQFKCFAKYFNSRTGECGRKITLKLSEYAMESIA